MNTRTRRVDWCSLPKDLLTEIRERLGIDVPRFRAVCTSWRSSLGPLDHNSPPFPIHLPNLMTSSYGETYLKETTIYRLEPLHQDKDNSNDTESSSSSSKGWLMKVEEWKPGCYHLLNPLSYHKIRFPKKLNLLDYRVFKLSKAYKLEYFRNNTNNYRTSVDKAIFSTDDSAILVLYGGGIYEGGKLAFFRLRDDKWTHLDQEPGTYPNYSDIMLYKGKFHAIDKCGQVVVIDSSTLKVTKVWPVLCTSGGTKLFVQSSGDVYVIADISTSHYDNYFQIFKLNEADWVEVESLEDRVAFLGKDCSFLASAGQLAGCERNCIYFLDNYYPYPNEDNGHNNNTRVFNLGDRTISLLSAGPTNVQVFWPPPTWIREAK